MEGKIINTHQQLCAAVEAGTIPASKAIAVSYRRRPEGRMGWCEINKSIVWSPSFKTDTNAAWYNHANKVFSGNRDVSLEAAKAWSAEQYGIEEWSRNRVGDYVPAIVNKKHPIPKRDESKAT